MLEAGGHATYRNEFGGWGRRSLADSRIINRVPGNTVTSEAPGGAGDRDRTGMVSLEGWLCRPANVALTCANTDSRIAPCNLRAIAYGL